MQVAGPGSLDVAHRVLGGLQPGCSACTRGSSSCKSSRVGSISNWCLLRQPLKVDDQEQILARCQSEASADHLRVQAPRLGRPAQDHRFDLGDVEPLPKDRDVGDDLCIAATESGDDAIAIGMRAPDRLRLQPNHLQLIGEPRADAIVGVKTIVLRLPISARIDSAMVDRWLLIATPSSEATKSPAITLHRLKSGRIPSRIALGRTSHPSETASSNE